MAVTTEEKRTTRGGALGASALALLLCAAAMLAPSVARAQTASKDELVDGMLTGAGTLTVVRVGPAHDITLELRLDGKKVGVLDMMSTARFSAHFRVLGGEEVVVMWASDHAAACPGKFRVIRVVGEADVSMTEEFGDCSDSPNITLETLPEWRLLLRFPGFYPYRLEDEPGFRKPPPTTWVYQKGVLKELKPAAKKRR